MDLDYLHKDLFLYARTGKTDKLSDCIRELAGSESFLTVLTSALYEAASRGRLDALKLLLAHGADAHAIHRWGTSALIEASKNGNVDCVVALLEVGANPNHRDMDGRAALDYAVSSGSPQLLAILRSVTKDPWKEANLAKLRAIDSSLATQALKFVKAAFASGQSGEVQNFSEGGPLPEWYREVLASIPLAGMSASLEWSGDDYSHDCSFLREIDHASIEKEEPYNASDFRARGVWPIASGTDACYWVIEVAGTPKSPVFFWDHSAVTATKAFRSFTAFLRSLKL